MRATRALELVSASVALLGGCSLFVSTSGFDDGATPTNEAGTTDGTTTDGGDAVATGDAIATAPDADAASTTVCDATFCDNFDDGPLGQRWDFMNTTLGGTLTLTANAFSNPSALEMNLPERAPGDTRSAFLAKVMPLTDGIVHCTFQANVVNPPVGNGDFALFLIQVSPTPDTHNFEMKVFDDGHLNLTESHDGDGGPIETSTDFGAPIPGQWVSIEVSADFKNNTMAAGLNGVAKIFPILATPGATSVRISLGETGDSDQAHFTARFDDFACTVK